MEGGGLTPLGESATSLVGEGISSSPEGSESGEDAPPKMLQGEELQAWIGIKGSMDGRPPKAPSLFRNTSDTLVEHAPLRPRSLSAQSTGDSPRHDRAQSTGDASFVSTLTEDQNKSISWDDKDANGYQQNPSVFMPELPPEPPPAQATPPTMRTSFKKPTSKWAKVRENVLKVSDVKMANPYESEAEAAILHLLEKARKRAGTRDGDNILPHVTEDDVDAFQPDLSRRGGDLTPGLPHDSSRGDVSHSSLRASGRPRSGTRDGHQRKQTLDNTFFGLANQLEHIHQKHESPKGEDSTPEYHLPEPESLGNKPPATDTDALVRNAAFLFRRNVGKRRNPTAT